MSGPADTESLSLDREELLDQVLAEYLRAVAGGAAPQRQALLDAYPDLADELSSFFADQDRFRNLAAPLREAVTPPPRLPLPTEVGPHVVLGEIARGGMGVVLRARHRELGRLVALKLLLAGPFTEPGDVERFRREAEAVASLDHPSIVPIYEVGQHQGLPYFTMKLMRSSLAQRLRSVSERTTVACTPLSAGRQPAAGKRAPLGGREAARLVAAVARAVHHAHARGVLHRDLKPANILLDEHGEPHVSDFGLARRVEQSAGLTATGAVVGTPAYMAPEQAAGKSGEVTVASDVYALGAVLYECLTVQPPFRGDSPLEVLRQVLDREPAAPRTLAPGLDADLETICLKCLEKAPSRRYGSAAELADDLERFLNGEPIRARPLGPAARLWRRARRQPVVVALVAALCLAVVGGFALVLHQWQEARAGYAEARQQRDEAEAARARAEEAQRRAEQAQRQADEAARVAEANFRQAHAAVNEFCVSFSDDLAHRPGLQALHRKLVHAARRYYREFVKQRGRDPKLRRELADTHVRVGDISARIGDRREAVAAYREALALYRELHRETPSDLALQRKVAVTLSEISTLQDLQEGLKTSAEALELFDRFVAAQPDNLPLAAGRALLLANRGAKMVTLGRFDEALRYLRDALAEQDRLARRHPGVPKLMAEMAGSLDNYGVCLSRLGRHSESLCCHLRALEVRATLVRWRPSDVPRQASLAAIQHHVGMGLRDVGQHAAAREAFEEALATRRRLAAANPMVISYQVAHALSLTNLGLASNNEGPRDRGLPLLQQAREILEKQLQAAPTSLNLRKLLGEAWYFIATTHAAMKRHAAETDALMRARRIQEALVRAEPDEVEYRTGLSRTLDNLGHNLWARKRQRESKEVFRQAIANTSRLVERSPGIPGFRRMLNGHYLALAEIEFRQGNAAASVEVVLQRWKWWPKEPNELFRVACELARATTLLGTTPEKLTPEQRQQRERWVELTLTALTQSVENGFSDVRRFREHRDLAGLRDRVEFQQLAGRVAQRARHGR